MFFNETYSLIAKAKKRQTVSNLTKTFLEASSFTIAYNPTIACL